MDIKQMGQGPDLVLLHGWSMHSGVWQPLAELLAEKFTLHLVDLPGHGTSEWHSDALQINNILDELERNVPETAFWLGWSLGGQ
jgi:pimeloyl-[acyl-carrier protein] methyl ester esterase